MHAKEYIEWLDKNNLLEQAKTNLATFKRVLTECLAVKKNERILIITDKGYEDRRIAALISGSYYLAAKELGFDITIVVQEPKFRGNKADENVIRAIEELEKGNILILSLSGKLGSIKELSHSYRTLVKENNYRFISATNLERLKQKDYQSVVDAIDVDYKELNEKGIKIKEKLDIGDEIRITTDLGTDLYININGKKGILNTGDYKQQGSGGNMPAGEVYIAPKWKNVEGKVVIDGSSAHRHGTQLIKHPITLTIKKGEVVNIKGGREADILKQTFEWAYKKAKFPWGIKRVGEIGIGINPKAKIIGATIIDEKTLGTAHIGIGSNYWFGGTIYAIIHLDQIFKNPKIYIDNEPLKI